MACFSCGSKYVNITHHKMKELAKGSPTRGKKVVWVDREYKQLTCMDCKSGEIIYKD